MSGLTEAAYGASNPIGRYFTIVSTLPSLILVFFGWTLIQSGAPLDRPKWSRAGDAVGDLGVGTAAGLLGVTMVVALTLHPLQFALTQLLEGYWGAGPISSRIRAVRILHYRRLRRALDEVETESGEAAQALLTASDGQVETEPIDADEKLYVRYKSRQFEAGRLTSTAFPNDADLIMPTRLGNVLRRYETEGGRAYGLDVIRVAPHLTLTAEPEHLKYLNDQRTLMDLSVRMCVIGLMGSVLSALLLWPYGTNLLMSLPPIVVAYVGYRGAVVVAHDYGTAVQVVLDLNRFTLYDRLKIKAPASTRSERKQNAVLNSLLGGDDRPSMIYHRGEVTTVKPATVADLGDAES